MVILDVPNSNPNSNGHVDHIMALVAILYECTLHVLNNRAENMRVLTVVHNATM